MANGDSPAKGNEPQFTRLSGLGLSKTLAQALIPTVDCLRDLRVRFGLRPYEVRLVTVRWSGGERGLGEPFVLRERVILPTPKVVDLGSLNEMVQPIGGDEIGGVTVEEISARYTAEQLTGADDQGTPAANDEQVFWEVVYPQPEGGEKRRRFTPNNVPFYSAGKFEWSIRLERQRADRQDGYGEP